jgi:HEAT repeat protein
LEPLLALLQDEDPDVGQTALQRLKTLNMLDEPNVREALLEALQYGNPIVRRAIAEALGRAGGAQQNIAPLVQALQDANSGVREAAADALGWIGDAEVVPALQEALLDSQFRVRWVAAAALGKIAGRHPGISAAITPALVPLLSDESQYVRSAAADVLRDLPPDRDLVEPFIQCLRDSYFGVRLTAVQVLGALDDPRAVAELIPLLTDSDDSVALAAVEALVQLGDPRAVKPLRALQKFAGKRGGEMARAIDRALARLRA